MPKKQSEGARFLLIWHSKYSTILSKIHSYRLLFWWWTPLGKRKNAENSTRST